MEDRKSVKPRKQLIGLASVAALALVVATVALAHGAASTHLKAMLTPASLIPVTTPLVPPPSRI